MHRRIAPPRSPRSPLAGACTTATLSLATLTLGCVPPASARVGPSGASIVVAGVPVSLPLPGPPAIPTSSSSASPSRTMATADKYLGVPYKWGGTSPRTGFDCSGFVQYVFAKEDVRLPRTSRQQARAGERMPTRWSALSKGDLVMFAEPGERISHVAIYAGNRRIIHASSSGGGVRYDDLDTRRGQWFARRMVAARRVVGDGRSLVDALISNLAPDALDPPDRAPRK